MCFIIDKNDLDNQLGKENRIRDKNIHQTPTYPQTSSLAVISQISGIASYFIVPLLGAIAAIITVNMAKKEIKESAGRLPVMVWPNGA